MFSWKKDYDSLTSLKDNKKTVAASVPGEVAEDAASTIVRERQLGSWMDEAFMECQRNGGFDNLKGAGKPLEISSGDVLNGILKNANVLPPWLELQHEIRDRIRKTLMETQSDAKPKLKKELKELNRLIDKYNGMVPSYLLQKSRVDEANIRTAPDKWA